MLNESFKISIEVECNLETLFLIMTQTEYISQWSYDDCLFDDYVGGKVELFSGWVNGKILDYDMKNKVTFSWEPTDWDEDCKSYVTYTFESLGNNLSALHIEHFNFPDTSEKENHYDGWYDYVINPAMHFLLEQQQIDY